MNKIICIIFCLLSVSFLHSQVNIAVRNINRGIELCNEGKNDLGLFYLTIGLRNEELPDSLRNIGELFRQYSYIVCDEEKVSKDVLEKILPQINEPLYQLILTNHYLGLHFLQNDKLDKAHIFLKNCMQACETIGRKDSIEYAQCLKDMALLAEKQNKYNEADSIYKQVYTLLKGDNRYKETFRYLLSFYYHNNYMYLHKYNEALDIAEENSIVTKHLYGTLSQEYIQSLRDQLYAYHKLNQYAISIELSDSICILQEKLTGKNNPNYYIALRDKVYACYEIEDYNNALKHSNELLQLTENTEYWLDNANYNVSIKHKLGKYEEAIKQQKKIIVYYAETNDTTSLGYIRNISNLRQIYDDISGYKDELEKLDQILISFEFPESATGEEMLDIFLCKLYAYHDKSFQEYSAFIKNTINKLDSILYSEIGYQSIKCGMLLDVLYPNYHEAIECIKLHLSFLKDKQMMKSQYGIYALNTLAEVYVKNQELLKAISINKQSLALNKELYGEQSMSYIDDLDYCSTLYLRIGDFNTYIKLQNEMFNIIKEHYGENSHLYIAKRVNPINAYFTPEKSLKELLNILDNNINKNLPSHIFLCTGIAYFQQNDYKNAIKYADLKLKKSVSSQDSIWGLTLKIAALKQLNKWDEVEECNHLEFSIANNKKDLEQQISCMEDLALISFKKGDFLKAQTLIKEITLNKWNNSEIVFRNPKQPKSTRNNQT